MNESNETKTKFYEIPYHLQRCPNCFKSASSKIIPSETSLIGIVKLTCKTCIPYVYWQVCISCDKQNAHITTPQQLRRHFITFHNIRKTARIDVFEGEKEDGESSESKGRYTFRDLKTTQETDEKNMKNGLFQNFERTENSKYFWQEILHSNGIPYLVGRACFNDDSCGSMIEGIDVEINFLISKLCLDLTRGQREQLSRILYLSTKKFTSDFNTQSLKIDLPQTPQSIRQRFMEGSNAVIPNLPHPEVKKVAEFSYVTIHDCIKDMYAHGIPVVELQEIETSESISNLYESKACQEIFERSRKLSEIPDVTLCILEWSDGFQPNTSSKQNRGSVLLKTISFDMPEKDDKNSSAYTYCVAVGPVKGNRDAVEKIFCDELASFRKTPLPRVFCRNRKKLISIYLEVLCVLQDQPERRKANNLSYGNSNYHSRWGWSCDVKSLSTVLPSCDECHNILVEKRILPNNCPNCLSWDFTRSDDLSKYPIPRKFPECCAENRCLHAFQLGYPLLKEAVEKCHSNIVRGVWSKTTARSYLSVLCLNNESCCEIIKRALNSKLLQEVENIPNGNELIRLSQVSPEKFTMWELPSTWCRKLELNQHVDTIMHLLFLGITKTIMVDCHLLLTTHNKLSPFLRVTKGAYESIQNLCLVWCKALPYSESGKFGAHVSENYLACARLLPWFYNGLNQIDIQRNNDYIDPPTHRNTWTKAINILWLRRRGLSTVGNAMTLRNRVNEFFNVEDINIPNAPTLHTKIKRMTETIELWNALLSLLMNDTMTPGIVEEVERITKLFLNSYSNYDKLLLTDRNPVWIRHFNMLSLLNLPDMIRQYGPLRNLWEGGVCGEAIIASVKPEITMGFRKNWTGSLLKKVLRKKAYEMLAIRERENLVTSFFDSTKIRNYSGLAELKYEIEEKNPISCFIHENKVHVLLMDDSLIEVEFENFVKEKLKMNYFSINLLKHSRIRIEHLNIDGIENGIDYGILLPLMEATNDNNNAIPIYTALTWTWKQIDVQKQFRLTGYQS